MIVTKTNPVGVDASVQRFQQFLYGELAKAYPTAVHHSFGRCYRNKRENVYVAEIQDGNSTEYKDVFWNDEADIVTYFGVNGSVKNGTRQEASIHLIMFCRLTALKPEATHRADEEVHVDLLKIIGKVMYGFHYKSTDTGLENVLREYKGSWRLNSLAQVDMHPIHSFRLNFLVTYNPFQTL